MGQSFPRVHRGQAGSTERAGMEPTMSKLVTLIAAAIVSVALVASPAFDGFHGGFHEGFRGGFHDGFHGRFRDGFHHGFRGGVFFGGGFYDPYFYDPYLGGYPYAYAAPPAAVWYFCPSANAYYPVVASCPVPWQPFPTR